MITKLRDYIKRLGKKELAGILAVVLLLSVVSNMPPWYAQAQTGIPPIFQPPGQAISAASGSTSQAIFSGIGGYTTCTVNINGTWSGTISFQVAGQSQAFSPIRGGDYAQANNGTSTTSNVTWVFPCAGVYYFEAYFSSYASGAANISLTASIGNATQGIPASSSGGSSSTITSPTSVPNATPSPVASPGGAVDTISYNQAQGSTGWWPFIFCDKVVAISTTSSGYTELVAASANKKIYVCAYSFQAAGTVSVKFTQGTKVSTACDTGEADITGAFPQSTSSGNALASPMSPLWIGTASDELCINLGASVGVFGFVTYSQQ